MKIRALHSTIQILTNIWLNFNNTQTTFLFIEEKLVTSLRHKFMQRLYYLTNWLLKSSRKRYT